MKERVMRSVSVPILFCLILFCPNHQSTASADTAKPTPLILEKSEGERRVWRPIEGAEGWLGQPAPFILKVDPQNGGSSHLVFVTEDLPPGGKIEIPQTPRFRRNPIFKNGM